MKMETVLHAPFPARVKELLVTTGSQVETGTPLVKLEQVGDEDRPRRRRVGRSRRSSCRSRRGPTRRPSGCPGPQRPHAPSCSATTYRPRTRTRPCRGTSPCARRCGRRGSRSSSRRARAARHLRRPRRAEPQPARRRGAPHRAAGAQLARALPHLPAEPRRRARWPARALPRPAGAGAAPLRRAWTSSARPSWRRRSSGSSWPSSARRRRSRSPPPCSAAGSTSPRRPGTWPRTRARLLERLGRATQLRFPVIGDLARSVRFRWFDQPAGGRRAHRRAGRGARRARPCSPRTADSPTGRERIEALAAHPRADRAVPGRAAGRRPPGQGADAGGAGPAPLPRVRPPRPPLDRGRGRRCDRPRRGRRLHPRRAPDPAGVHDRHRRRAGRPRGRAGRRRSVPTSPAAARATTPSSTSTCTGPTHPRTPTRPAAQLRPARGGAAVRPRRTTAVRRGLRRRRPSGRLLRVPSRPATAAWSRTTSTRGVHPMVGRRLNLWRLRNFDVTRIEAPEDVLLYECVARENPADRRLVALAQVRQLAVVRDEEGTGHRPPARRAGGGELPGGDPTRPRRARCGGQQARHEPRVGPRLAGRRDRQRRSRRARQQDPPAHRRRRHRGGARPGPRRSAPDGTPVPVACASAPSPEPAW